MNLRQYIRVVFRYRYLLVAGLVLGLVAGAFNAASGEKSYRGGVAFFVSSAGEGTVASANAGDQFALRRVNSYLALIRTDRLGQMIIDDTGLELSSTAVRNKLSGRADLNTVLLTARVDDPDRERTLIITESLSRMFPRLISEVERPEGGDETVRLEVVSGPGVRVVPVQTKRILAVWGLASLILALVLALLRELTDNRLASIDQAVEISNAPLLGLITSDRHAPNAPLILEDALGSVRAEEYRQVRTSLQYVDTQDRAKVIVVTSSVPSEGKSVTAANLALAIARSGQRVVLVDADLRKPMVGTLFGLEQSVGFSDVLRGHAALDDVLQWWGESELGVLPAGAETFNPSELLGTVATKRVISSLRFRFDTVVIDSPPLVPVTDAAVLSTVADGVVLMVRPDKVTKAQFQQALSHLDRVHATLIGLIGSMMSERSSGYASAYTSGETVDPSGNHVKERQPARSHSASDSGRKSTFVLDAALGDAEERLSRGRSRRE